MLLVTMPLNGLLMIALPIGLAWVLRRRFAARPVLFGAGLLTFIASQVVHLPLNEGITWLFRAGVVPPPPPELRLAFNATVLGLTSGLCEETARYIAFRRFLPNARTWRDGMMFGAGHGGIEAILFGVLVLVNFAAMYSLSVGGLDSVPVGAREAAGQALETFWATPPAMAFLGALERAMAICTHLALSLLVLVSVIRRKPLLLLAAITWHAALNAIAVALVQTGGVIAAEGFVAAATIPAVLLIVAMRRVLIEPAPAARL